MYICMKLTAFLITHSCYCSLTEGAVMESSDEEDFLAFNADIIDNDAPAAVLENGSENGDSVVQQSGTQVYESP